jgi:hypothetical protein
MPGAFHILGSGRPRPDSRATIFCDGSADDSFRTGVDVELSHWIPNRTPGEFRADTSTEICLKFATFGALESYDLVVNNHLDVDGVLSVYALVDPRSLQHREAIVGAAEMGDFWAYGGGLALSLFVTLTDRIAAYADDDTMVAHEACFDAVRELLSGAEPGPGVDDARAILAASLDLVNSGRVRRTELHERFVSYVIPQELAEGDLDAALHVPEFNAPLSTDTLLLPQARNFRDKERVQLVSAEIDGGWCHDLWYPGYMWADTEDVWRAPGFQFADSTNAWFYGFAQLTAAVEALRRRETADGEWTVADRLLPFKTIPGRNFPVVLSYLGRDARPAPSRLPPADVAATLAPAFA